MLDGLTKPQRNRLKRCECGLCEMPLHRTIHGSGQCGAIFSGPCSQAQIITRALACLSASRVPHIADISALSKTGAKDDE